MQTNNKLREALEDIGRIVEQIRLLYSDYPYEIHDIARKADYALAVPPRQCDIGTDNEQIRRWKEFCDHYEVDRSPESFARWAQGPHFEEGGGR